MNAPAGPPPELHLPDLPEVPISLGPAATRRPRPRLPWHLRLREGFSSYLPLLVMALLVLASWWLVKNSPRSAGPAEERPVSSEPDYTMEQFALERFDAQGRLKLRIEGARLKHFPATDRIEIEDAQIRAIAAVSVAGHGWPSLACFRAGARKDGCRPPSCRHP